MSERERKGQTLTKLALEGITIVFGVLLALGVNEWRTSLSHQALAEQASDEIREEIARNLTRLESSLSRHNEQMTQLQEALEQLAADEEITYQFNFAQTILRKQAWQSAIVTQAVQHLDPVLVRDLSDIYELMATYRDHELRITSTMGTAAFYKEENREEQLYANVLNMGLIIQLNELIVNQMKVYLDNPS